MCAKASLQPFVMQWLKNWLAQSMFRKYKQLASESLFIGRDPEIVAMFGSSRSFCSFWVLGDKYLVLFPDMSSLPAEIVSVDDDEQTTMNSQLLFKHMGGTSQKPNSGDDARKLVVKPSSTPSTGCEQVQITSSLVSFKLSADLEKFSTRPSQDRYFWLPSFFPA